MADVLDVLIVGGGAAGYTAGLFAARDRGRARLIEKFTAGEQVLDCEPSRTAPASRGAWPATLRWDPHMRTRVPGILAAGDEATPSPPSSS